jgi:hypothetical protein
MILVRCFITPAIVLQWHNAGVYGRLLTCAYCAGDVCRSSMSFTNFYAAPLCAMGRAQLLTGRD